MSSTQQYRKQIASIQSTQSITHAMELVAASRIRKAQKRIEQSRPYAHKIREVLGHLASSQHHFKHRALTKTETFQRIGLIVVATDSGLCGGLNLNLFKATITRQKQWAKQAIQTDLCLIGRKAMTFFKRFDQTILAYAENLGHQPKVAELIGSVKVMLDAFDDGQLDAVYLCYNQFVNTMVQHPTMTRLLPLEKIALRSDVAQNKQNWDYLYEAPFSGLLDALLSRYVESQVYQAVIENIASEQAARMVAMKSATDNAGDLIRDLKRTYNKVRQAGITQEIAEIVGGAEAV